MTQTSEPANPPSKRRSSIFSEHYSVHWNIGLALIGIILGVVVAYLFFKLTEQRKQIAFTQPTTYVKVFDRSVASPYIEVRTSDGQLISENIYVAEITIWNAGNVPIEPVDVRDQLRIVISPANQILDMQITRQIRPEIARYSIRNGIIDKDGNVYSQDEPNTVTGWITWEHLDPGFGAVFQITFASNAEAVTKLHTRIEGYVVGISEFTTADQERNKRELAWRNDFGKWVGNGIVAGLVFSALEVLKRRRQKQPVTRGDLLGGVLVFVGIVTGYTATVFISIMFSGPTPPL